MEKALRKQQNLLVDAGKSLIMFGIWAVAKVNMYLGMSSVFAEALALATQNPELIGGYSVNIFWIAIVVFLVTGFAVRLYIGLSAIAEGKGRKKGWGYLLLTAGLLLFNLQINWQAFELDMGQVNASMVLSFVLELASMYVMVDLMIASIRVKRLRKKSQR